MGRLRAFVNNVLDYTWPVVTTVCAIVGSDRLNRWLRADDDCWEPDVS